MVPICFPMAIGVALTCCPIRSKVLHLSSCIDRFSVGQPGEKNHDRPRCNRIFETWY
jgi:hypothetical protein